MKRTVLSVIIFLLYISAAMAQAKEAKPAKTEDVASIDSILKAVYDVISGDAGEERDWDRFLSLFHKDARLIPVGKNPQTGVTAASVFTPADYIERTGPVFAKQGFHEREIGRRTDRYGDIAQVFSAYEAFRSKSDKEPFLRGINSFQLLYDGKRWWVLTIYWQAETPENPIPKDYLFPKPSNP
ncbi:MAG TPA: hypothetical protein PKD24_10620 [Pyrinomonadaceae bacterium]|nr:hypothetical protein [Pyrinomonadaceae bacterium]HMP65379.1 hypothetical protein [Pyrinomonadaceae bacterium]